MGMDDGENTEDDGAITEDSSVMTEEDNSDAAEQEWSEESILERKKITCDRSKRFGRDGMWTLLSDAFYI